MALSPRVAWSAFSVVMVAASAADAACSQSDVYKLKQAGIPVSEIRVLCPPEGPPVAPAPAQPGTASAAATGQKLNGGAIQAALTGNTASGVQGGTAWRQYFGADGTTSYHRTGKDPRQGSWAVRGDQYCERWSADAQWECTDLFRDGETLIWRYPAADWPAKTLPGKQMAEASVTPEKPTPPAAADQGESLAERYRKSVDDFWRLPSRDPQLYDAAREILRPLSSRFLQGPEREAYMQRLRPSLADYHAVYRPLLADALAAVQKALWDSGLLIRPEGDQTEIDVVILTTDDLLDKRVAVPLTFARYAEVLPHLQRGVPIAMFRYRAPGARAGLAFDGLARVSDRWVFVPKPWMGLAPAKAAGETQRIEAEVKEQAARLEATTPHYPRT